jgi:hypothetical protein
VKSAGLSIELDVPLGNYPGAKCESSRGPQPIGF